MPCYVGWLHKKFITAMWYTIDIIKLQIDVKKHFTKVMFMEYFDLVEFNL